MDSKIDGGLVLNTPGLYDNEGHSFSPLSLMDKKTYDLNQTAYDAIKPIRITTSFASKFQHINV